MSASPLGAAVRSVTRELELAWASEEERELELTAAERFARDPFLLADEGLVWIYGKWDRRPIRLNLFPSQRELGEAWIDIDELRASGDLRFRNSADEKSRQMGETWAVAYFLLWALSYHTRSLFAHHYRAAEIDDGGERNTWRSLFGKIRYMDRRLGSSGGLVDPAARRKVSGVGRPLVFRPRSDTPARVENPERGGVLYAGEQTPDPGRGGTFDGLVVDEAAFVPWGEKVHAALDEACPVGKLYLSTVNGDDNVHARIVDERPQGWTILRHHWSQHPIYSVGLHIAALPEPEPQPRQPSPEAEAAAASCALCEGTRAGIAWDPTKPRSHRFPGRLASPWYDERVIGKTDEQVAQELDVDRERALSERVFSEFQAERHVVPAGIPYDHLLPLELGFDYGLDCTAVVICQDHPSEYRVIGELEVSGMTPDRVAAALRQRLVELGVEERFLTAQWTRKIYAVGDPSGESRSLDTGRPLTDEYHKQGFSIVSPPRRLTRSVGPSINALKRLLLGTPKPLRVSGPTCPRFVEHARNNRWPVDRLGRRRIGATTPLDDKHNHMMRAKAYLAVAKFPPPREASGGGPDEDEERNLDDPLRRRRERRSGEGPLVHGSSL